MKQVFTLIILLAIGSSADAQGISTGLRTGVGNTFDITAAKEGIKHNYWEKQLFLRNETKGRIAFEFNATQYNYGYSQTPTTFETFLPMDNEPIEYRINNNNVDFGISAQFDLSCPYFGEKCPLLKNFKSYIGITAVAILNQKTETYTNFYYNKGRIRESSYGQTGFNDIQFGVNHTTKYSFNRFFLTSTATLTVNPRVLGSFTPQVLYENSLFSLRIGAGYTL